LGSDTQKATVLSLKLLRVEEKLTLGVIGRLVLRSHKPHLDLRAQSRSHERRDSLRERLLV
jgi:hypothetical protein